MKRLPLLIISALLATLSPVQAEENSAVVTYPVKGDSARAIYEDIKKNSPRIAPNATFAFTAMATKTVKSHKVDPSGCSYKGFRTSVIYNFIVPKRQGTNPLAKSLGKKWDGFVAYLQKHEEGHRDIWRKCIAEYDQTALSLKAPDCTALDVQREDMFTALKRRCIAKDEAYDVIFRKEVVNHTFMREALRNPSGSQKN
jgi:predicted secreted Zn-dependent protease